MAPTVTTTAPTNGLTTQASTTGGSVTLPATAANDILILLAVNAGSTGALTTGGTYNGGAWTSINSLTSSTTLWGGVWWSRCTGNHSGQTVTTATAVGSTASAVAVVSGCRIASSPLSGTGTSAQQTVTGMAAPAAFNTADADTLVCYTLHATDNITFAVTSPAGTTKNIEVGSSGGSDSLVGMATVAQATAGSTGSFAGTHAVAAAKVSFAFALAPEPPGPIPDVAMVPMGSR